MTLTTHVYLPCDRVNGVQADIQKDSALAHIAEHLCSMTGGFPYLPWHIVQGVVGHDHCAGEDGHNATASKVLCHQVGQIRNHAYHADCLLHVQSSHISCIVKHNQNTAAGAAAAVATAATQQLMYIYADTTTGFIICTHCHCIWQTELAAAVVCYWMHGQDA